MSRQAAQLKSWLARYRRHPGPGRILVWPVGKEARAEEVARLLEGRARAQGCSVNVTVALPGRPLGRAGLEPVVDPSGAGGLAQCRAVVLVAAPRRSTVLHAYRIFKELTALSTRPCYGLVLSGRPVGLAVEAFGERVRELAVRHTGVAWHFIGSVAEKAEGHALPGLTVLLEALMGEETGGRLELL
ncbi:MAG: hypothetical protein AB1486_10015 [Planctomycetota bacterium]